jgi:hypothetical protein
MSESYRVALSEQERLLEIRVPISPMPHFFRRIHFLAASLRRFGGAISDHCITVFVGGDEEPRNLYEALPWSGKYPIVWRWADREAFRRDSYWETSREVFRHPAKARYVMCVDADVIFVRDFSDLLTRLDHEPAVAGVIAHASPFRNPTPLETWQSLAEAYGIPSLDADYEHTGWGFMARHEAHRLTPVYFNFGMVIAPSEMMDKIGAGIADADKFVTENLDTFFRFQIALTLVIKKNQLPTIALPMRYNFPNDPGFDRRYPEELRDIRILHYLRCEIVHRENDFFSLEKVAALIKRSDLQGSNEVLRRCLNDLYSTIAKEESQSDRVEGLNREKTAMNSCKPFARNQSH